MGFTASTSVSVPGCHTMFRMMRCGNASETEKKMEKLVAGPPLNPALARSSTVTCWPFWRVVAVLLIPGMVRHRGGASMFISGSGVRAVVSTGKLVPQGLPLEPLGLRGLLRSQAPLEQPQEPIEP